MGVIKYNKHDLEKLIFEDKLSYIAIGKIYGVSSNAIKKAAKKIAKKKRASKKDFYDANELRTKVRKEIIEESFEKKGLLDRITSTLQDMGPIVVIIERLIASLISCILSIDIVKVMVKPETLKKMDTVYKKAMAVM